MLHTLKTVQPYFEAVLKGLKKFEVRLNDRQYVVGDLLELVEIDIFGQPTGRRMEVRVTYLLHGGKFGIDENFVVMGIEENV